MLHTVEWLSPDASIFQISEFASAHIKLSLQFIVLSCEREKQQGVDIYDRRGSYTVPAMNAFYGEMHLKKQRDVFTGFWAPLYLPEKTSISSCWERAALFVMHFQCIETLYHAPPKKGRSLKCRLISLFRHSNVGCSRNNFSCRVLRGTTSLS